MKIFPEKAAGQPGVVDRRGRNQAGGAEGTLQHQGLSHGRNVGVTAVEDDKRRVVDSPLAQLK